MKSIIQTKHSICKEITEMLYFKLFYIIKCQELKYFIMIYKIIDANEKQTEKDQETSELENRNKSF